MGIDWNAEQMTLAPEDLDAMADKTVTVVREIEKKLVETKNGRSFNLYEITVEAKDKRILNFAVFENDIGVVTKLIRQHNLTGMAGIKEFGIRLTLGSSTYTKKGETTPTRKVVIVKVEPPLPPAQTGLTA